MWHCPKVRARRTTMPDLWAVSQESTLTVERSRGMTILTFTGFFAIILDYLGESCPATGEHGMSDRGNGREQIDPTQGNR